MIARDEKSIVAQAAVRKKKEDDEWEARYGGFWGKVKLSAQVLVFGFVLVLFIILLIVSNNWITTLVFGRHEKPRTDWEDYILVAMIEVPAPPAPHPDETKERPASTHSVGDKGP